MHLYDYRLARCCIVFSMLIMLGFYSHPSLAHESADAIHNKAIQAARKGNYHKALHLLEPLVKKYPKTRRYFYDLITVLSWQENDDKVIRLATKVNLKKAPIYTLEAIGKSARNIKNTRLSIQAYRIAFNKDRRRLESGLGLVLSLADDGKISDALDTLKLLEKQSPGDIRVMQARAYALQAGADYFGAIAIYQRILTQQPQDKAALRGLILSLNSLGAAHLAADVAATQPNVLSPEEQDAILNHKTAISIRWGRLWAADARPAREQTKKAIAALQQRLIDLEAQGKSNSSAAHNTRFDLMVALRDDKKMTKVLSHYDHLKAQKIPIPAYSSVAVADAYLYLEQPEHARKLYQHALDLDPNNTNANRGLFYAYIESENYQRAMTLADQLAQKEVAWKKIAGLPHAIPNENKLQADSLAALARAYADDWDNAQNRLETLVAHAPANADLRVDLGSVYLWREWPRRALQQFDRVLLTEPNHFNAQMGRIAALQQLGDFKQSSVALSALKTRYPKNKLVEQRRREKRLHDKKIISINVNGGNSSGNQEGSKDVSLDLTAHAAPINDNLRGFAHTYYNSAKFPEGTGRNKRLGAGLEYHSQNKILRGEITSDMDEIANGGIAIGATWMPTDHWSASTRFDSFSNDIPLRARLDNTDAWSINFSTSYRLSESFNGGIQIKRLDFSDGNNRTEGQASVFNRLISLPKYKLDLNLSLYASNNTLENTSYFNPDEDVSSEVTLNHEWVTFRRYERFFRQQLSLSAGWYWQQHFGGNSTWLLRYGHDWSVSRELELLYGVSVSRPVYDGNTENSTRGDFSLRWNY